MPWENGMQLSWCPASPYMENNCSFAVLEWYPCSILFTFMLFSCDNFLPSWACITGWEVSSLNRVTMLPFFVMQYTYMATSLVVSGEHIVFSNPASVHTWLMHVYSHLVSHGIAIVLNCMLFIYSSTNWEQFLAEQSFGLHLRPSTSCGKVSPVLPNGTLFGRQI